MYAAILDTVDQQMLAQHSQEVGVKRLVGGARKDLGHRVNDCCSRVSHYVAGLGINPAKVVEKPGGFGFALRFEPVRMPRQPAAVTPGPEGHLAAVLLGVAHQ